MSIIKSFSVGYGDMYYIEHNSDNFTIIDCMLPPGQDDLSERIVDELVAIDVRKGITRFISTHPDQDHVNGLRYIDQRLSILNFYCVRNDTIKETPTKDFKHYCKLRDSQKAFYIYAGCKRRWMNVADEERGSAGINILWPDTSNQDYKDALEIAEGGGSPNNTSCVIQYSLNDGVTALWMGDLETDFMEKMDGFFDVPEVDLLFAPHHGRESGRVPEHWLDAMDPAVIVLGEGEPEYMHDYPGWNTLDQHDAGDLVFDCLDGRVDVYGSSATYSAEFLYNAGATAGLGRYIGSFNA